MIERPEFNYQPTVRIPLGNEPAIPFANTKPSDSAKAMPKLFFETRIIRKVHGRDVRMTVPVNPDGTTVFDNQPEKVILLDMALQQTDKGQHRFQDYAYDLWIMKRELMRENEDAIGSCQWLVRAQAVGYHYKNGIGNRIPKEFSVNKKEDETVFYVSHSSTPYEPGRVYTQLLRTGTSEFLDAEKLYRRVSQDAEYMKQMKEIERTVDEYRKRKAREMLLEKLPLVAD